MFSYDGSKRPTVEEIKAHPWLSKPYSVKMTRQYILEKLTDKRAEKTMQNSQAAETQGNNRGDQMNELIREASVSELEVYKFNDMADYDIDVSPGFVWEEL